MPVVRASGSRLVLNAYRGDAKTLLAFDLLTEAARTDLAGFTVQIAPPGVAPFYLQNNLRFENPAAHAQDPKEPAFSTINAPIHKFRWVHVPGSVHQGLKPVFGTYAYTVTPRYFDEKHAMAPLDARLSVTVEVEVAPLSIGALSLGFTRGFTQSQAFVRHFGLKAKIKPADAELVFDTSQQSGTNAAGETFTYSQQYEWLGFTARQRIFDILDAVKADKDLSLDVFAYDLNEPDLVEALLAIGHAKRARIILDNAALHHDKSGTKCEDQFEDLFAEKAGADAIKRGKFGRYAHDKVFIVKDSEGPKTVLTGSTNFSVTGLYVNSNHVLVFDDRKVATTYAGVFEEAWADDLHTAAFARSDFATKAATFKSDTVPDTSITFSPHDEEHARDVLGAMVDRIEAEGKKEVGGSVLFAVMELKGGSAENPVYEALTALHSEQTIFTYGISDNPDGIALYPFGQKTGVLVTGKPLNTKLPPPFNQVPNIDGIGHQIHHKFVVCGFNSNDPVVYCGSSNLALKGEQVNGDNLLTIRDGDVATAFAIEAVGLIDHFDFLDKLATGPKSKNKDAKDKTAPPAVQQQASAAAQWFLSTSDAWSHKFFDPTDLHSVDRLLFASKYPSEPQTPGNG